MTRTFLPPSAEALDAVSDLYDFVWPTAAALWNLRWQVVGYCQVRPQATVPELRARFIEGSGLTGANLRRACVDVPWEQQTEKLAAILLTNLFAIYEGWTKRVVALLGLSPSMEGSLQQTDIETILTRLPTRSQLLDQTICAVLRSKPRYNYNKFNNWMKCYRYFKAIRNKQLHDHGIADEAAKSAYDQFAEVATPTDLGVPRVPQHYPVVVGSPVRLSIRGVVGFSDVLLRMIVTLDAELSAQPAAELVLDQRWTAMRPPSRLFKRDAETRRRQLANIFGRMGYGGITVTASIEAALHGRGLVNWT